MIQKLDEPMEMLLEPGEGPLYPQFVTGRAMIFDAPLVRRLIADRQRRGVDKYDEIWDGVYVMSAAPSNPHQRIVRGIIKAVEAVVDDEARGETLPGANISDRREDWEKNHRCPDVVVVLKDSEAIDCGTHWLGGPDFIVEVQSPDDDTELKTPFYSQVGVRELLIIHRDTRHLRLFRHNGSELELVAESHADLDAWVASEVIPAAFRCKSTAQGPRTEVKRTDKKRQKWTF
jgi:Uma2 family endonuclease